MGNSYLFNHQRTNKRKKDDVTSLVGTVNVLGKHKAVVLIKRDGLQTYDVKIFDGFDSRTDALQQAHYINANMILRNGDPLPEHTTGGNMHTLATLKKQGYMV